MSFWPLGVVGAFGVGAEPRAVDCWLEFPESCALSTGTAATATASTAQLDRCNKQRDDPAAMGLLLETIVDPILATEQTDTQRGMGDGPTGAIACQLSRFVRVPRVRTGGRNRRRRDRGRLGGRVAVARARRRESL